MHAMHARVLRDTSTRAPAGPSRGSLIDRHACCRSRHAVTLVELLFGKPIANQGEKRERVGPLRGIPILGLDALASAAYGPEALLTVLLPLGIGGLYHVWPLTLVIVGLLFIVFISYSQTIGAYPNGGGSYTVAKENLGRKAALLAAAALGLDYMLNVAVGIAAGVGALVSAVPYLLPFTLPLCLGVLLLLALVNWRGVRESGAAFATPTYLFIASMLAIIALGGVRAVVHGGHPTPVVAPMQPGPVTAAATSWLMVRAFANGTTAMTGVEAVSNGVPIFHEPTTRGARKTLAAISCLLMTFLIGVALLCRAYHVTATEPGKPGYQSILSQLAGAVFGRGIVYEVSMASIFGVLALSANTSFADFPRLARLLAADGFLPPSFENRGRRLAFSYGLLVLTLLSAVLLVAFGGVTDRLIPLFAVGALLAFTMSQSGMVMHWHRLHNHGPKLWINAVGAVATGVTVAVVLASKFVEGAWISALIITASMALFWAIRRHHDEIEAATRTDATFERGPDGPPLAIVPVRRWDRLALKGLQFACALAPDVIAVQVLTGDHAESDLSSEWQDRVVAPAERQGLRPPELRVLRSEYRKRLTPLLEFVSDAARSHPDRPVAVIVPELVERRWYHTILQSHMASMIKAMLLFRGGPRVVVVSAPWYEKDWKQQAKHEAAVARLVRSAQRT
jgi:amino acid transporter